MLMGLAELKDVLCDKFEMMGEKHSLGSPMKRLTNFTSKSPKSSRLFSKVTQSTSQHKGNQIPAVSPKQIRFA